MQSFLLFKFIVQMKFFFINTTITNLFINSLHITFCIDVIVLDIIILNQKIKVDLSYTFQALCLRKCGVC